MTEEYFAAAIQRFMAKIQTSPSGCWDWTGKKDRRGYGRVKLEGKEMFAHRLGYMIKHRALPLRHLHTHHTCENKSCVNPDHLIILSPKEHIIDYSQNVSSYRFARTTHCPKGHEYDTKNTILTPKGGRLCRICVNAGRKRHRDRTIDEAREKEQEYRSKNRDYTNSKQKTNYWANREKIRAYQTEWRKKNEEKKTRPTPSPRGVKNEEQTMRRLKSIHHPPELLTYFYDRIRTTEGSSDPDCWWWQGLEQNRLAHRFSYELYKGRIPEWGVIHFICGNPECMNPSHLVLVDPRKQAKS